MQHHADNAGSPIRRSAPAHITHSVTSMRWVAEARAQDEDDW